MTFEDPGVFWLLMVLPFLLLGLGLWGWVAKRDIATIFCLNLRRLRQGQVVKYGLAAILMVLLVCAWALPRVAFLSAEAIKKTGEIALLVDVSASMGARADLYSLSRLERTKPILSDVVDRMEELGEVRLSLHGFTSIARSHVPLVGVEDYPYLKESMKKVLDIQSTPGTGTSLGRPILNVMDKFSDGEGAKLIVLFSDGETFLGLTPGVHEVERGWMDEAIQKAGEKGIKVITVGIGELEGARIPLYDRKGTFTGEYHKLEGIDYVTYLKEDGLQEIASRTGGRCFSEQNLQELIPFLEDNLAPGTATQAPEETLDYRYVAHWFLFAALPVWAILARRYLLN